MSNFATQPHSKIPFHRIHLHFKPHSSSQSYMFPFSRKSGPQKVQKDLDEIDLKLFNSKAHIRKTLARSDSLIFWYLKIATIIFVGVTLFLWLQPTLVVNILISYMLDDYSQWYYEQQMSPRLLFYLQTLIVVAFLSGFYGVLNLYYKRDLRVTKSRITVLETQKEQLLNKLTNSQEFRDMQNMYDRYVKGTPRSKAVASTSVQGTPGNPNAIQDAPYHYEFRDPPSTSFSSKLFDYVMGSGPDNQYALICYYCSAHNGLCPAEALDRVRYWCPYCKAYNGKTGSNPPVPPHIPTLPHNNPRQQQQPQQPQQQQQQLSQNNQSIDNPNSVLLQSNKNSRATTTQQKNLYTKATNSTIKSVQNHKKYPRSRNSTNSPQPPTVSLTKNSKYSSVNQKSESNNSPQMSDLPPPQPNFTSQQGQDLTEGDSSLLVPPDLDALEQIAEEHNQR